MSTWTEAVDLAAILAADYEPLRPAVLGLFYAGMINALYAEPETGKSWLALLAAVGEISAGRHVVMVDFEMGAPEVTNRLRELGAAEDAILTYFHYFRPEERLDDIGADIRGLAAFVRSVAAGLVVFDGMAEALAGNGLNEDSNVDVADFFANVLAPLARTGAAVVIIDHVTKSSDGRGRYARGAGHKLSAITGGAYLLQPRDPFGRGHVGRSTIIIGKDRHAGVPHVRLKGKRIVGAFVIDATGDALAATVEPATEGDGPTEHRPTWYMEKVSRVVEKARDALSLNKIRELAGGSGKYIDQAAALLVDEGYLVMEVGSRNAKLHRSARPYRQEDDPASDRYLAAAPDDEDDPPF